MSQTPPSSHEAPLLRGHAPGGPRRCTRCILPETFPGIEFDAQGVCSQCREFDARFSGIPWDEREKELRRILDRYRGRGLKYDVLVPFSGGKDSTYTLWLLKNRYDMRCLALNFDNGFRDPAAYGFVNEAAAKLGVDLVSYAPDRKLLHEVYGKALELAGDFCAACVVLLPTAIFRFADMYGIRLIVDGFSEILEAPPLELCHVDRVRFKNMMKAHFSFREMRWDYFFPSWKRFFTVKQISMPQYIEWDLPRIYETLNRELDYRRGVEDIRYDCLATPHSSYLVYRRFGFGKYEYYYSRAIRAGVLSRDEALRIAGEREHREPPEGFDRFLADLGHDRSVLEGIENRSVTRYRARNPLIRKLAIAVRELLP